ncbi:MAG TPA: hypothetical protein VFH68_05955 [Polyangia bacterium]|jgi:hypothetical protein|nr:hypothetical protein [Polyangia bacterium]
MAANADPPVTEQSRNPELAQAEREIERTRARVSRSMIALREAVSKRTDWREWVRERPGVFLAAAFALGMFWGRRSGRRLGPARNR